MNEGYLNISENGAGRIHAATPNISGLCIKRLQTCRAIVIIGSTKISVIHDEGYLSLESIEKEFHQVGEILDWAIFYNPEYINGALFDKYKNEMQGLLNLFEKNFSGFVKTSSGCVSIHKASESIQEAQIMDIPAIEPQEFNHRKAVRHLNNLTAFHYPHQKTTIRQVPTDIQFQDNVFVLPSNLAFPPTKVVQAAMRFISSSDEKQIIKEYLGYCELICPKELKEYMDSTPSGILSSLENSFETDKNPFLLLELISATLACLPTCGGDPDCCEYYIGKAKDYISLALTSDNEKVRQEATLFSQSLNDFDKGTIGIGELYQGNSTKDSPPFNH